MKQWIPHLRCCFSHTGRHLFRVFDFNFIEFCDAVDPEIAESRMIYFQGPLTVAVFTIVALLIFEGPKMVKSSRVWFSMVVGP